MIGTTKPRTGAAPRRHQRTIATALALLALALPAHANLIEAEITFDLRETLRAASLISSNTLSITPFTVQQGDSLDLTFNFARGEALRFDSSTLAANSICGGQECLSLVFTSSLNAAPGLVLTDSLLQLFPYDGDFVATSAASAGEDCANCLEVSGKGNITDGTATITGGRVTAEVTQIPGTYTYDRVYLLGFLDDPRILVHRDFEFDLSTGLFQPNFYSSNNLDIDPLILEPGDEYDFRFSFANNQSLEVASSTLAPNTICGGQECVSLVLLNSGGGLTNTTSQLDFAGLAGDALVQSLFSSNEDCLNCVEVSGKGNLTDGTVGFAGGRYRGLVDSMTQPANYSRANLQVFADNPVARDADAVPEPSTLLLAAAGLAGLALRRRRG